MDAEDLGVGFLIIVGHKFCGSKIGALFVQGISKVSPLCPMLFGGEQEQNFKPVTENVPMFDSLGRLLI